MTRFALFAAVVSTALLPLSAFAHGGGGGGHGGGGGGGGGHAGGGGGGHAGGHAAAQSGPRPISPGASSHQSKASTSASTASSSSASRSGSGTGHHNADHNHANHNGKQFAKDHPRRNEVNHRDRDQLARIHEGLKSGKLTPTQAKQLLSNDRSIKQQEHADVKANGGFLTKSQQHQINQEQNANSRSIHNDEHPSSPTTAAKAVPVSGSRPGNPIGAPGSRFADQHPRRDEVNSRVGDQRARIEQGVKSGKLTPTQAKQLMSNDHSIKQQEHADVKANGGFLTKSEQRQFNQEENANSRSIRSDEHANTAAKAVPAVGSRPGNPIGAPGSRFADQHPRRDEVNSRVGDQRARIEQGVKSGKLTPAEAKQLMSNDRSIKQQEHADVKANGGFLTKSEQRQFNQEENANSRSIRSDERAAAP